MRTLVFIAISILLLAGCGGGGSQDTIVGKWRAKNGLTMEFTKSGGVIYNDRPIWLGVWKEEEKGRVRITTSGIGAPPPQVCAYEVKSDILSMSGCGPSFEMSRVR